MGLTIEPPGMALTHAPSTRRSYRVCQDDEGGLETAECDSLEQFDVFSFRFLSLCFYIPRQFIEAAVKNSDISGTLTAKQYLRHGS